MTKLLEGFTSDKLPIVLKSTRNPAGSKTKLCHFLVLRNMMSTEILKFGYCCISRYFYLHITDKNQHDMQYWWCMYQWYVHQYEILKRVQLIRTRVYDILKRVSLIHISMISIRIACMYSKECVFLQARACEWYIYKHI